MRICFVAPNAYPLLAGRSDIRQIGGAEVQQVLIAGELARRGHGVSFVTLDHGQPDGVEHDGAAVFKMCANDDGWPGLRFIHPRWTSLWRAMTRADAEVYYQRTYGVETGQVALWCRRRRRRMIAAIANDRDCDRSLHGAANLRERWLYFYGLRRAHRVVAQTESQQRLLADHFGLFARVIRSCSIDPPAERGVPQPRQRWAGRRILWIGRFRVQKRPDLLLALTELCPDIQFDVVGEGGDNDPAIASVTARLGRRPNVTLHGFVPQADVGRFYDHAALLLCTSDFEGFPNTFLEAWARSLPVVSTFDPDGIIAAAGLGAAVSGEAQARDAIHRLLSSFDDWRDAADRARQNFIEHHTITAAGDAYEEILDELRQEPAGGTVLRSKAVMC